MRKLKKLEADQRSKEIIRYETIDYAGNSKIINIHQSTDSQILRCHLLPERFGERFEVDGRTQYQAAATSAPKRV